MKAPLILAIETATRAGSISVARGEDVLASVIGDPERSHSTDLIGNIDMILRRISARLDDVDLFAVAVGPGSFTGLRIGLATVKSFSVNTGKPCVGISTLMAIAHASQAEGVNVISLLPAGRGEVFAQMFSIGNNDVQGIDTPEHIAPPLLLDRYGQFSRLFWAGEGARLHSNLLSEWAEAHEIGFRECSGSSSTGDKREWILGGECRELSASVALLALDEYKHGHTVRPEDLHASYVRPSDAEITKSWQHPQ